jgi:arylsulfatase A-like enzyme
MESVIDDTPGLPAWELTFMERLQCAGYHTGAFGKIHMMPEKGFHEMQVTGGKGARWTQSAGLPIGLGPLGRDYAAWLEARHPGGYEAIYEQRRRSEYRKYHTAISNVLPLEEYIDYWIAENTCDFVRRDHGKPFFVWCGFCGPHGPVDPPKPYDTLYAPEEIALPDNYTVDMEGNPRETAPEEDRIARRWCAYYMGSVTLIDDMVGRIVSALEEKGVMDNTLIVFTTDHGEMMFERGRLGKGNFFEPIIRVPLIVVPPGGSAAPRQIDGLVETFDIAPTVLDYAMAEIPATMSASSLRPIVEGQAAGKGLVLCEYVINDRSYRGICVRSSRFKYEYWTSDRGERFFDLHEDPLERRNLIDDDRYRDRIAEHRRQMIDRLIHTPA